MSYQYGSEALGLRMMVEPMARTTRKRKVSTMHYHTVTHIGNRQRWSRKLTKDQAQQRATLYGGHLKSCRKAACA